ncbi:MAG: hypothetical protein AB7F43_06310 [Bacteriovoracia bacterium]
MKLLGNLVWPQLLVITLTISGCTSEQAKQFANSVQTTTLTSDSPTATVSSATSTTYNAIQIIPKADTTGSFELVSVPVSGGVSVKASRIFDLSGTQIQTGSVPSWYSEARVFLTSTRTSGANPSAPSGSNTPCAYFDSYTDYNPDTSGYYTIDGYNSDSATTDIDQCGGTNASELNQLAMYVKLDRRFMNSTDKIQLIIKAKVIDSPNSTPTASSCVVGGFFDGSACSTQYYTVSMRNSPGAATKPFYVLFPSAKALDLLSESILLPIHMNTGITTISIDRVKGGAVFYGISVIRLL